MSDQPDRRAVDAVLESLNLAPGAADEFVGGPNLPHPAGRLYGGQVLAQVLTAAQATVSDRRAHSLHAYFLRMGRPEVPVELRVGRLRDGRSFSVRSVEAVQDEVPILSSIVSFQADQDGLDNSEAMPALVPPPDQLPSAADALADLDHPVARFWSHESAFDVRHVGGALYTTPQTGSTGRQLVWARARASLPDNPALHQAMIAYACDQVMLEPALRRSGLVWSTPGLSVASLDHAMWWHRPARADEWLLYVQSSPSVQGGRGLGKARVFTADGTLVASIAQEGMIRVPPPA